MAAKMGLKLSRAVKGLAVAQLRNFTLQTQTRMDRAKESERERKRDSVVNKSH